MGGAERYVVELARHMARRVPTRIVSFAATARDETIDGTPVTILAARPFRGQASNPFTLSLARALRDADVIHCHQTHVLSSSFACAVGRFSGTRVFTTDLGGGGWDISSYVSTDRWYHGHLHISAYSRQVAGHGDKPWAHVILAGVDVAKFSPDPGVAREASVLFVGRLLPHKGLDDLIDAMPPGLHLDIVGHAYDPSYFAQLQARADGKSVSFLQGVDDAGLVDRYRRAMCVVLPSVYRTRSGQETVVPELFGQAAAEGLACETPAIVTRVASLPEVVDDGVTGFVVPPGDPAALRAAIERLAGDRAAARTMGEAGRRRVLESFRWEAVVDRCLAIYAGTGDSLADMRNEK
jgi:glycosyltransferase involved in cell wall biosynthesis